MNGSPVGQVTYLFKASGIFREGESRKDAKAVARASGAVRPADVSRHTGIHSYGTADTYRPVWVEFLSWARQNHGLKDIEKTTGRIVGEYLLSRVERGVAYSTWTKEASALGKLENALASYAEKTGSKNTYSIREAIEIVRPAARGLCSRPEHQNRAYGRQYARKVVDEMQSPAHQLVGRMQLEGGFRVYEAAQIRSEQLMGYRADPWIGGRQGVVKVEGKGGKEREIYLSPQTYARLSERVERGDGVFKVDRAEYSRDLEQACKRVGLPYSGTHGLRYDFAQNRYFELLAHGYSHEQCEQVISWELGHNRAEITMHYLK